ncbi:MAG: hypothetical protein IJX99_10215 [Clostridia bacterium]|nr:hypothetical protein [Clostridia bacterium]
MNKINFKLKNCYGINFTEFELDFLQNNTNIIYASNGIMKTSFANTMKSIVDGTIPKDRIRNINGEVNIWVDETDALNKDQIIVVDSEKKIDNMEENTSLLASQKLKKEYDEIYSGINKKLEILLKSVKSISGLSREDLMEIANKIQPGRFHSILEFFDYIHDNIEFLVYIDEKLKKIKYKEIFNKDTEKLFGDEEFLNLIEEYINTYNRIFEKSSIFVKGKFNHYNAEIISKNLSENGYFGAGHKIRLKNSTLDIENEKQLDEIIEEERNRELNDEELKAHFDRIDKQLKSPAGIRKFKEYLLEHRSILHYLCNISDFRLRMIVNYMHSTKNEFESLIFEYKASKDKIKKILDDARKEETTWHSVKEIFKARFFVPFDIEVKNKEDVILREERLSIEYKYGEDRISTSKDNLIECLSNGEKKAYYILNLLYEFEKAKETGKEYFIVIDDLADSFDYKNKYAIVEYLCDLQKITSFKILILTHNFDFYRTVSNRLGLKGNAYFAIKDNNEIKIKDGKYFGNVFYTWKKDISDKKNVFIASIPFIRNISEYMGGKEDNIEYNMLTHVLHIKKEEIVNKHVVKETAQITLKDISDIFQKIWGINSSEITYDDENILDFIMNEADNLIKNVDDTDIFLENKIVLSIAIRLKAELYMINRINNDDIVNSIKGNQTRKLFTSIKFDNTKEDNEIKEILSEVLLMTSENIHINSFMYEPIIDLSIEHLKKLYLRISDI